MQRDDHEDDEEFDDADGRIHELAHELTDRVLETRGSATIATSLGQSKRYLFQAIEASVGLDVLRLKNPNVQITKFKAIAILLSAIWFFIICSLSLIYHLIYFNGSIKFSDHFRWYGLPTLCGTLAAIARGIAAQLLHAIYGDHVKYWTDKVMDISWMLILGFTGFFIASVLNPILFPYVYRLSIAPLSSIFVKLIADAIVKLICIALSLTIVTAPIIAIARLDRIEQREAILLRIRHIFDIHSLAYKLIIAYGMYTFLEIIPDVLGFNLQNVVINTLVNSAFLYELATKLQTLIYIGKIGIAALSWHFNPRSSVDKLRTLATEMLCFHIVGVDAAMQLFRRIHMPQQSNRAIIVDQAPNRAVLTSIVINDLPSEQEAQAAAAQRHPQVANNRSTPVLLSAQQPSASVEPLDADRIARDRSAVAAHLV